MQSCCSPPRRTIALVCSWRLSSILLTIYCMLTYNLCLFLVAIYKQVNDLMSCSYIPRNSTLGACTNCLCGNGPGRGWGTGQFHQLVEGGPHLPMWMGRLPSVEAAAGLWYPSYFSIVQHDYGRAVQWGRNWSTMPRMGILNKLMTKIETVRYQSLHTVAGSEQARSELPPCTDSACIKLLQGEIFQWLVHDKPFQSSTTSPTSEWDWPSNS